MLCVEVAYCVRYIHLNGRSGAPSPWSLRQFVVHQRFDYDTRMNTWIFVSPPAEIQEICSRFYPDTTSQENDRESLLQIHYALVHWAVAQWRPYLAYLTKAVDQHVRIIPLPQKAFLFFFAWESMNERTNEYLCR
jgi:hypothetical protein